MGNVIFVMGGAPPGAARSKNEAYYPVTDTWMTKQAMPTFYVGGAIGATSSKIYVASGYPNLVTLHIYDVPTDSWTAGAPSCVLCFVCRQRSLLVVVWQVRTYRACSSLPPEP